MEADVPVSPPCNEPYRYGQPREAMLRRAAPVRFAPPDTLNARIVLSA